MLAHPGLRLLIGLKLRGGARAHLRRLKRPKNWIFIALGLVLMFGWLASFLVRPRGAATSVTSVSMEFGTRAGLLVLILLTLVGAFSHRGLYLPKEEIELCFSAPISRSDLIRYRLVSNLMKSLFAGIIFGLGAATRMPVGAFGFAGAFVTMLTIPIFAQATAILLGGAENTIAKRVSKLPLRLISILLIVSVVIAGILLVQGQSDKLEAFFNRNHVSLDGIVTHPIVRSILLPFEPWARMITARDAAEFWPWFAFACAFWVVAFELTVRIRVDFRELSLATSADIAKRLNRMRRGTWASGSGKISKTTIGWSVPWIFGRGSFGAVAWRKLASIVREARGTMTLSAMIIVFLTVIATVLFSKSTTEDLLFGSLFITVIGTFYLCTGLRFDFRRDLEIMESVKNWPLRPWALFLATLVPEVALVASLLAVVVLGRAIFLRTFDPALLGIVAFQPLFTLAWVALDNAVFLFSPVRYTPGEEGALQHMGRSMVSMLLRFAVALVVVVVSGGPAVAAWLILEKGVELDRTTVLWGAGIVAWIGLALVDVGLVAAGGFMLKRFDVARDKGM